MPFGGGKGRSASGGLVPFGGGNGRSIADPAAKSPTAVIASIAAGNNLLSTDLMVLS